MSRAAGALALLALLAGCGADPPAPPPSVLLLSWDTVRADRTSLYGHARDTTPTLAALADEALVFERAYSTASWTLPAHMSMLTGLYPRQHGVKSREEALALDAATLAQRMRRAGYRCRATYYQGWIDPRHGFDRGFEEFRRHADGEDAGANALAFTADATAQRPVFLFAHLFDAHNANLQAPGAIPYDVPGDAETFFDAGARDALRGLDAQRVWRGDDPVSPRQREAILATYDAGIRYLDDKLAEWVGVWRESGLLDRAVLVVTSDHGESLAQRKAAWSGHGRMYEEGLRVPLLVRLPGGEGGGRRVEALASIVDLVPTVLEACGLEPDPSLPGRSLLGSAEAGPRVVAQQITWMAVRDGDLKFVLPLGRRSPVPELAYDLAADPGEEHPLHPDREPAVAERLAALRAALIAPDSPLLHAVSPPIAAGALSAADRAALEAMGYADEVGED